MANITLIRGGAIGDFVLTLPAINSLHKAFLNNNLHLIGKPATLRLKQAQNILNQDDPRLMPLYRKGPIPQETLALFAQTERVLAYAVDSDQQLKRQLTQIVQGPVLLCDPRPFNLRRHIIDHLLSPLQTWDIPVEDSTPRIALTPRDHEYVDALPRSPQVIVHIGSSSPGKCWPESYFRILVATLRKKGWDTAILCGPIEIERGFVDDSLQPPDLRALAGLLSRASLFIGNDSGPGHIAAAVGTATLSLFGPTDPQTWAPRNKRGNVLQAPRGDIENIAPALVLETALNMLESTDNDG